MAVGPTAQAQLIELEAQGSLFSAYAFSMRPFGGVCLFRLSSAQPGAFYSSIRRFVLVGCGLLLS